MGDTPAVQGFMFDAVGDEHRDREHTVCKIVARADATDADLLAYGPAFRVEFGDGHQMVAFSSELSPWFPT